MLCLLFEILFWIWIWILFSHIYLLINRETFDRNLVHAIESVIIEWTHQIRDVLKTDSVQPLLDGLNPSPFVEIKFWENKNQNLDCIYEQVIFFPLKGIFHVIIIFDVQRYLLCFLECPISLVQSLNIDDFLNTCEQNCLQWDLIRHLNDFKWTLVLLASVFNLSIKANKTNATHVCVR